MKRTSGPARMMGPVGELLVTIGVLLALFLVYQVWWTGLDTARAQSSAFAELDSRWAGGADAIRENPRMNGLSPDVGPLDGTAFARLHIPAFGSDYRFAVVSGTSDAALDIGPGHYSETQAPGEPGNFAVAGHRVGRGSPFNDLDALRSCDALVYATADDWLIYRVLPVDAPDAAAARAQAAECLPDDLARRATSGAYEGLSGISVVRPEDVWVIDAQPGTPGPPPRTCCRWPRSPPATRSTRRPSGSSSTPFSSGPSPASTAWSPQNCDADRMYAWLFRRLPGPAPVQILLAILLAVAVFLLLMEVVFPAVESLLPYTDVAVTGDGS